MTAPGPPIDPSKVLVPAGPLLELAAQWEAAADRCRRDFEPIAAAVLSQHAAKLRALISAAARIPEGQHQFHLSVAVQGDSCDWTGEPWRLTVRANSLTEACAKAARVSLPDWVQPDEDDPAVTVLAASAEEITRAARVVLEPWEGIEGPDDQYQPQLLERVTAARILARAVTQGAER